MNRRGFLGQMLVGAGALAFAPIGLRGESFKRDATTAFARGLEQHRWLAGWKSVGVESFEPCAATIEGRWPQALSGVLYRNGPAWFERDGFRYQHWFDGDGMLHAWNMGKSGIKHRARMVETPKFRREQRIGRFVVPAAGTTIENAVSVRNNDDANTANTAVMRIGDRVFALWEAGSAFEVDAESLATIGPETFRDDLTAAPFSAHPLRDRDGSIWNFGSLDLLGSSGLLIWHVGGDGKLIRATTIKDEQRGYLHSFAMTDRHLIFVLTPYRMEEGKAFFERMRFAEDLPCRVAVVVKDSPDSARWFDVDFGMVYHFADAFEQGNEIVVRAARHASAKAARSPMSAAMQGRADTVDDHVDLVELRIDLGKGRAQWHDSGIGGIEFPAFDPRAVTARQSTIYAPSRTTSAIAPWSNAISAIDLHREKKIVHSYGDLVLAEEHLFVPKPGSERAGQGWLLGTLLDFKAMRSGLVVLDAEHVDAGPLATAWLPYAFPLGFHGAFASSA